MYNNTFSILKKSPSLQNECALLVKKNSTKYTFSATWIQIKAHTYSTEIKIHCTLFLIANVFHVILLAWGHNLKGSEESFLKVWVLLWV